MLKSEKKKKGKYFNRYLFNGIISKYPHPHHYKSI